ncbi:hypothetical protein L838_1150 [Mycobacterium avium MAV_120709_2344]|nr:hypothetical protein L838_1150 [Mycobacterium avium MAV_120709_2344]
MVPGMVVGQRRAMVSMDFGARPVSRCTPPRSRNSAARASS